MAHRIVLKLKFAFLLRLAQTEAHGKLGIAPFNILQNHIMLKKILTQSIAVCAIAACSIFTAGCGDDVAADAGDDAGEGEGEFEMGEEPTGDPGSEDK